MKECPYALLGGQIKCGDFGDNRCLQMSNESVPNGNLDAVYATFRDAKIDSLWWYLSEYSEGGSQVNRCLASGMIAQVITRIIEERLGQ